MKFSTEKKIYKAGEAIFPTDMSSLHRKDGAWMSSFDKQEVKRKISSGKPFIVVSEPYYKDEMGWFEPQWYIDVQFECDEVVYTIFNTDTNVFKNYWKYAEFVSDCEECAALGY